MLRDGCIIVLVGGTSVRKIDLQSGGDISRAEQIAQLRLQMDRMSGGAANKLEKISEHVDVLPVDGELNMLLPGGGLARRAVTHVSETPALMVEILSRVTAAGGFVGVVGWPELSYAGVAVEGLERIIAVPEPGMDPLGIAGVLAEGLDMVVYRSPVRLELSPVRARPLLGKLCKGKAALVLVGATVASPALTVTAKVEGYSGIGRGSGRITGVDLRVRCQAKGMSPASGTVTLGQGCLLYTSPSPRDS